MTTERDLDGAARQLAIRLMRLTEAIDHEDAEAYPPIPMKHRESQRGHRHRMLDRYYTTWFRNQGETE